MVFPSVKSGGGASIGASEGHQRRRDEFGGEGTASNNEWMEGREEGMEGRKGGVKGRI